MADADCREPPPVRVHDLADLHQVAGEPHHHLHRQHQLRHLEHTLPRRHHLLQQQGRQEEPQGRTQTTAVSEKQGREGLLCFVSVYFSFTAQSQLIADNA